MTQRPVTRSVGRQAILALAAAVAAALASPVPAGAEALSEAQKTAVIGIAKEIAATPAVVAAVKTQNAKKVPLAAVQEADRAWMRTTGVDGTMRALMENPCARAIKDVQRAHREVAEAFVMDDQGANVCMTNKTSDYWQGDEAKWQKSFGAGPKAVFLDKPAFDESAQAYLVQVSVPVVERGRAIGAVTVGINLEHLAAKR